MRDTPISKYATRHILISEPDEEQLELGLEGRELSPALLKFLKTLIKTKKWTRKINIPSSHDGTAAVLVFTSELKESGLEIFSELHVFLDGKTLVEKWQVMGENTEPLALTEGSLGAVEIEKVWVEDPRVHVRLKVPMPNGDSKTLIKTFDFALEGSRIRIVPHPLLEKD